MTKKKISEAEASVSAAKDILKQKEVMRIGLRQTESSKGKYLNFDLAVELTRTRLGVVFSKIELEEVRHNWLKKLGTLKAGTDEHEVDRKDGFCYTCNVFHSGESFDTVHIVRNIRVNVPKKSDGRHNPPSSPLPTIRGERSSPYDSLMDTPVQELRINTRLWQHFNSKFDD